MTVAARKQTQRLKILMVIFFLQIYNIQPASNFKWQKSNLVNLKLNIYQNLSRNCGEVGKSEEVDQPNRNDEADERVLGYEVDTGEVGGEKKTDDWHHHSELNTVQHQARN